MNKPNWFQRWVLQNGSYKIVALFVALVLWVAILGRKDFVLNFEIPLNVKLSAQTQQLDQEKKLVRVKVGGPRLALKRFAEANKNVVIDLERASEGRITIRVQENDFVVPAKVRIISISPSFLTVDVVRKVPNDEKLRNSNGKN